MKTTFISLSFFLCLSSPIWAQSMSPTEKLSAICPGNYNVYVYSQTGDGCLYNWEVTNGHIAGGHISGNNSSISNIGVNVVSISWVDTPDEGKIKATSHSCDVSSNNKTKEFTYYIKSINGVTPTSISGIDNIPPTVLTNRTYSITPVNYPRGTLDPKPYTVTNYSWETPTGWTVIGGGNTKDIVLQPDNYSGGNIRVRAINECSSGNSSNWSPNKTVTRNLNTPSISGSDAVVCSNTSSLIFTCSPVEGAASYAWTLPSGWSGSSSSSTITVTPNGLNGGTISVRAISGPIESASGTKNISLTLYNEASPPHVSGPDLICSSGNYSLSNQPSGSSNSWSSTNSSYISINSSSGLANYAGQGGVYIIANVYTACGSFQKEKFVWGGNPDLTKKIDGITAGTTPVYPGNLYNLTAESQSPSTSFNYNNYTGTGDMTIDIYYPSWPNTQMYVYGTSTYGSRHVRVTATNTCGSYYQDFVFYIPSFFKAVYPNPAKEYLTLDFNSLTDKATLPDAVELYHETSMKKELSLSLEDLLKDTKNQQGNKYILDIKNLKRGVWYLHAVKKGYETEVVRLLFE